jgi:hypothetical protein
MDRLIEETTIDNKTIQLVHDDVAIDRIELDQDNPRIRYRMALEANGKGKKPTEKELEKVILNYSEVKRLLRDIEQNGGLRERVILQENGTKLKAVEGNCRLTCIRALHEKDKDDPRWQTIPARILPRDVNPKHTAILLTDFHVAGKIKWEAHEKAGQIYHMSNELGMSQDEIALYWHASKGTVSRFLAAYAFMMDRFLKVDEGKYAKHGARKWSYFDEFFKKKELKAELKENSEFGDNFCRWVGEGALPQGQDVRYLPTILKHPEAREKFESGTSLADVKKLIEATEPEQGSDFFKQLGKMRQDFTSAAKVKEILLIRTDKVARQRLIDTYEAMVGFMMLANVDIPKVE